MPSAKPRKKTASSPERLRASAERMAHKSPTVNADEIGRFSALAGTWWNPDGPMAPLHKLNPVRLDYIKRKILQHPATTKQRTLLDIGCAAGLVSEDLARWGTQHHVTVTGMDASSDLIAAARQHAKEQSVDVTYAVSDVDALVAGKETFDIVLALEVIEHVDEQRHFIQQAAKLLKPGGLMILSTLNRSAKGFLLGIVGAEYLLRWLPRGTHDWRKFVRPSECSAWLSDAGLTTNEIVGLRYHPLAGVFSIDAQDVDVNYILCASKI